MGTPSQKSSNKSYKSPQRNQSHQNAFQPARTAPIGNIKLLLCPILQLGGLASANTESVTKKSPHYFICKGSQNVCQIIRYVDAILQKSSRNDGKIKTSRNHELQTGLTTLQDHQQSNPLKGLGQLKLQNYLNIKNNYFFNQQEQPKEGWYEHFVKQVLVP